MAYGELDIFRKTEWYCDRIYALVRSGQTFDMDTVGSQRVRAADSVGASIVESYGRFHYAERAHFLYYARGNAYETVFWLRCTEHRRLLDADTTSGAVTAYNSLIISLNSYIRQTKGHKVAPKTKATKAKALAESAAPYVVALEHMAGAPF